MRFDERSNSPDIVVVTEGICEQLGQELITSRTRFILRLLRQNFPRVEGPGFDRSNSRNIYYQVWKRGRDLEGNDSVRIAFGLEFLSKPNNDFARTVLRALREAKGIIDSTNPLQKG